MMNCITQPGIYLPKKEESGKKKFTLEEDTFILYMVSRIGQKSWKLISSLMPGRNARQVRERYKHYLSQNIQKDPWTEEEDQLIIQKVNKWGQKWTEIAKLMPGRTNVNIKNRYHLLMRKMKKNSNSQTESSTTSDTPSFQYQELFLNEPYINMEFEIFDELCNSCC